MRNVKKVLPKHMKLVTGTHIKLSPKNAELMKLNIIDWVKYNLKQPPFEVTEINDNFYFKISEEISINEIANLFYKLGIQNQ